MNAIPLVFSFLIVFCIIQTAFLKEAPIALIEYQAFKEMLSFQREKCNTIERLLHKRARSSSMHSTASKSSKRTTKLHPSGRIYLYAIRPASTLYPTFKTALSKLFTLAYPFCSAEQIQNILNTLLDAVNETQNTNEPLTLEYFEELGKASELLTKLWKGTPHYNIEKKEGVIPLQHVLCFDPTFFRKPIYFPKAHYLVLKAFFDKETFETIIQEEKDGVLTKQELTRLQVPHLHFHFSRPKPKNTLCKCGYRQELLNLDYQD